MKFRRVFNYRVAAIAMVSAMLFTYPRNVHAFNRNFDINGDGVVDMVDFQLTEQYYNSLELIYDVNGDGIIDIFDMTLIAKGFDPKYEDNDFYSIGNTHSNLLNSSYVVVSGEFVYYRNTQDGNKLYKSKLNSELKVKLSDDQVSNLNLIGDRLYYRNDGDGGRVYSVKTDGTGRTLIFAENVEDMVVSGQFIYYKAPSDKKVYRVSVSGKGKETVVSDAVDRFSVRGNVLYYINVTNNGFLFRISTAGKDKRPVTNERVVNFAYDKGRIYYIVAADNKIYSIDLEGTDRKKVSDFTASSINVNDGFIYYSAREDGRLYKMKTDGTQRAAIQNERLSLSGNTAKLLKDGNWIFYTNASDEDRLYRITTDGNSKKDMETVIEGRISVSQVLNFREGPSTTSRIISTLPNGTKVEVIGETINQGILWYKINATINGTVTTGFVSSTFVLIINDDRMWTKLGVVAGKYESNGDPGIIADNPNDRGGKSYGAWQFASRVGTVDNFIVYLVDNNTNFYNLLVAAKNADGGQFGTNFDNQWKALAVSHYDEFLALQRDYVKKLYYDKAVELIFKNTGIDTNKRSFAFRNAVWSTAVQHGVLGAAGPNLSYTRNGVITAVHLQNPVDELDFIRKIYLERAKVEIYFSSYDPNKPGDAALLNGIRTRFINEGNDAAAMYNYEMSR